ncbi:hypothetical protein RvY_07665 [Ramazzottius varieornatus]|uniref:Uncharacterized protein n=1 Tax=Ramazzottius varieornatus TaxID=947166 RepID=A0A1D1V5M0_RAMVA|nr:hypothetical protein RvY_07665 [Ramazzottius varieornatus]
MAKETMNEETGRRQARALNKVMRTAEFPTTAKNMKIPMTVTFRITFVGISAYLGLVTLLFSVGVEPSSVIFPHKPMSYSARSFLRKKEELPG